MAARKARKAKVIVQARVDPDALAALDELADEKNRSRSEMIAFAIGEFVERHGDARSTPMTDDDRLRLEVENLARQAAED